MSNKEVIKKKSNSLKSAIKRYNEYKLFVDKYKATKSLDDYIDHIRRMSTTYSKDVLERYEKMIMQYNNGNFEPLLKNLYDRLLTTDEYQKKISSELKSLLRDL